MRIYLCCKTCILLADDSPHGPKHVAFIYDTITSILILTVIDKPDYLQDEGQIYTITCHEGTEGVLGIAILFL